MGVHLLFCYPNSASRNILFILSLFNFIETSNIHINCTKDDNRRNKTAILTSPIAVSAHTKCLSFIWVITGEQSGTLAVSFLYENETVVAWQHKYDPFSKTRRERTWVNSLVDLPSKEEIKVSLLSVKSVKDVDLVSTPIHIRS